MSLIFKGLYMERPFEGLMCSKFVVSYYSKTSEIEGNFFQNWLKCIKKGQGTEVLCPGPGLIYALGI